MMVSTARRIARASFFPLAAAVAALVAGCVRPGVLPDGGGSDASFPACSNGADDDGDLTTDFPNDIGCADGADDDETNPPVCSDGLDNDSDGLIDYPADPGCSSEGDTDETNPECSDGVDNDGDMDTDFPADDDCVAAADLREAPDPECSNGVDDNGDGLVDFPADPGCTDENDPNESGAPDCPGGLPVEEITYTGLATGTTSGASTTAGSCGGAAAPEAFVYVEVPVQLTTLSINTFGTIFADLLYVQSQCADPATELGCASAELDPGGGVLTPALLEVANVAPGGYFIGIDGMTAAAVGSWYMRVFGIIAGGQPCVPGDPVFQCDSAMNFDCAEPIPGLGTVCVAGLCSDGYDNDTDAIADWPLDPGCEDVLDNDEADPPTTPQCYDGMDNDADGLADYPTDPGCEDTNDDLELDQCVPGLLVNNLPATGNATGATSGTNFLDANCDSGFSTSGPDEVWLLTVPSMATVTASTVNPGTLFNTNLSLRDVCDDATSELACSSTFTNGETIVASDLLPGSYFIVVDGQDSAAGAYELSVSGAIAAGQPCDPAWTRFSCELTTTCEAGPGPTGMVCALADCADGADNDGDGDADFPLDPGCVDLSDASESDACPAGLSCPECGNGVDDDADALIDYPTDLGCGAAADADEEGCLYNFTGGAAMGWTFSNTCTSGVGWTVDDFRSVSASHSLYYGNPATQTFDCSGATNSGNATSTSITLPAAGASMTFWVWIATEGGTSYDQLGLDVIPSAGSAVEVWDRNDFPEGMSGNTGGVFILQTVDLSAYNGQTVQLRWTFNTTDGIGNSTEGVYIDDIFVNGACP